MSDTTTTMTPVAAATAATTTTAKNQTVTDELRRWIVYLLGIAFLGFLDDSLGRGEAAGAPRGWRGHGRSLT